MFIRVILIVVYVVFVLGIITQIIVPGIRGRPFFPIFRAKNRRVNRDLALSRELLDEAKGDKEINDHLKKAAKISQAGR